MAMPSLAMPSLAMPSLAMPIYQCGFIRCVVLNVTCSGYSIDGQGLTLCAVSDRMRFLLHVSEAWLPEDCHVRKCGNLKGGSQMGRENL